MEPKNSLRYLQRSDNGLYTEIIKRLWSWHEEEDNQFEENVSKDKIFRKTSELTYLREWHYLKMTGI
jgi:CRISPR/Cas system CSM-associated protein Csm4 (group 5 of RAMP superfamily)